MDGMMRFRTRGASPRLGGSPLTTDTGYPWVDGDILYASDLNAAFLPAVGVIDGSNAPAGRVGEVIQAATGAPGGSIGAGGFAFITSMNLTAGDWDMFGYVTIQPASGTTVQNSAIGPSSSNTTWAGYEAAYAPVSWNGAAFPYLTLPFPGQRLISAVSSTVYLLALVNFTGGTCNAWGRITARRQR